MKKMSFVVAIIASAALAAGCHHKKAADKPTPAAGSGDAGSAAGSAAGSGDAGSAAAPAM